MFVHQTELFKGMSQGFLDTLNKIIVTENYNRGDFLFIVLQILRRIFADTQKNLQILRRKRWCMLSRRSDTDRITGSFSP